jgi:hypothetical protein
MAKVGAAASGAASSRAGNTGMLGAMARSAQTLETAGKKAAGSDLGKTIGRSI